MSQGALIIMLEPSTVSFCHCPLPFSSLPGLEMQHTKDSLNAIEQRLSALTQRINTFQSSRQFNIPIGDMLELYAELSVIKMLLDEPSSEAWVLLAGRPASRFKIA